MALNVTAGGSRIKHVFDRRVQGAATTAAICRNFVNHKCVTFWRIGYPKNTQLVAPAKACQCRGLPFCSTTRVAQMFDIEHASD
jgi:hypothetical protein